MGALLTIFLNLAPYVAVNMDLTPTPEQERAEYRRQLENEVAQFTKVKPDSIQQVVKFSIEQDMLAPRTELQLAQDTTAHVIDCGLPGFVRVSVMGPQDAPEFRGRNFTFFQHDLTDPKSMTITSISCIAGQIVMARDGEDDRYHWSVQLIQDAPPVAGNLPDQDPVRFLVRRDATEQEKEIDVKVSAATFAQLRTQHAAELDAYLRPILRDFHQEGALFGVSSQIAWQVLGQGASDPALRDKLKQVLARLDADDFHARQDAVEQLRQMGQPAAQALAKLDRAALTPQQVSAVDAFLAEFAPVAADQAQGLANDKAFLLDVLLNDDPSVREMALKRLQAVTGKVIELNGDPFERERQIAKLRSELVPTTQPALSAP
jgi:hypothetical protein